MEIPESIPAGRKDRIVVGKQDFAEVESVVPATVHSDAGVPVRIPVKQHEGSIGRDEEGVMEYQKIGVFQFISDSSLIGFDLFDNGWKDFPEVIERLTGSNRILRPGRCNREEKQEQQM